MKPEEFDEYKRETFKKNMPARQTLNKRILYDALSYVRKYAEGETEFYQLPDHVQDLLMDLYMHEMPYGTQTGDTGTPDEWLADLIGADPDGFMEDVETGLRRLMARKGGHNVYMK